MKLSCAIAILLSLAFSGLVSAYSLTHTVIGSSFYNFFTWEAISDPTHGRVNYVDKTTSIDSNLTYATDDTFILRADHLNTLDRSDPGRDSVRIKSKKAFRKHVAVFNIRHMPQGCGTWPAVWETKGSNWPTGGEVDIIEGVNDQSPNSMTLHSTSGCTMPDSRGQTGGVISTDCDSFVNNNQGCSVRAPTDNSYGPSFNRIGGGWYAMERTTNDIKIWFWPRTSDNVPSDIASGSSTVNPRRWGTPAAYFPDTYCDIDSRFQEHNIIINLTLCGDWAGNVNVYGASGCPSTCEDFVDTSPSAFKNAYFDFASIRVYE